MTERTVIEQRTLALAGVAQAARIVDLAAKTGSWPAPFVETSIQSLFCFDRFLAPGKVFAWVWSSCRPV